MDIHLLIKLVHYKNPINPNLYLWILKIQMFKVKFASTNGLDNAFIVTFNVICVDFNVRIKTAEEHYLLLHELFCTNGKKIQI